MSNNLLSTMVPQHTKVPLKIPVTNGLNNHQLYQTLYVKPKILASKGGKLSNNMGVIPGLRKEKRAKSTRRHTAEWNNTF
jgi:hypothetical protein